MSVTEQITSKNYLYPTVFELMSSIELICCWFGVEWTATHFVDLALIKAMKRFYMSGEGPHNVIALCQIGGMV